MAGMARDTLLFAVPRPAISQHLAVLKHAGLVEMSTEQGRNRYSVVEGRVGEARAAIVELGAGLPGGDPAASNGAAPAPAPTETTMAQRAGDPSLPPPDLALE